MFFQRSMMSLYANVFQDFREAKNNLLAEMFWPNYSLISEMKHQNLNNDRLSYLDKTYNCK